MLEALRIVNLGAVDEVTLELEPGLTVLTGETGVGKTLLVEALHLVLGGADRGLPARHPAAASRVEAVFTSDGGDEVVLARERSERGRLRASVDGALASAAVLAAHAERLCELHGQHEHQVLRTPSAARHLLDRSAAIDDTEVRALRVRRRDLVELRDRLGGDATSRARRLELVAHECDEIDAAEVADEGEVERLLAEAETVSAVLDAREALEGATALLDGDDEPTAAGLVATALAQLPRTMPAARDQLAALLEGLREASGSLRGELEAVEADPARLEALHGRVASLQALVRKHGQHLGDVLRRRDELGQELERLRGDEVRSGELDAELGAVEASLAVAEDRVAAERERAAAVLAAEVLGRLPALALPHARFEVQVAGPAGEQVQLLFAGSGAFAPAPLADAASGGELSRVMLAITLATGAEVPCVVFDEVDAGVGGATARSLASRLAELALDRQVLVVTHLATVAAVADHHLVVARPTGDDAPASVRPVVGVERVREIARLLAGDPADPVALSHAEALLAGDTAVA